MKAKVVTPSTPDAVDRALHIHIEAHNIEQDEYLVFTKLFRNEAGIKPFQGKKSLKSAAQAFSETYPNYLFIIDRDYELDAKVEKYWEKFPENPLIMWRKRAIENYFLKPDWLAETSYCKAKQYTKKKIENCLLKKANEYLLKDAFLYVFHQQDELLKRSFLDGGDAEQFSITFKSVSEVQQFIKQSLESNKTTAMLFYEQLCEKFERELLNHLSLLIGTTLTTTQDPLPSLTYGKGRWLDLMDAKRLWNPLCSHLGTTSKVLLEELFSCDESLYPPDFIELRDKALARKRK